MLRVRADRRVATVLFLDIVGSTTIAASLGDQRWRELLATFRRAVRRRLRQHGGHEIDTSGDGFFTTFESPAGALHAAAGIVADVQQHGLDVRCGLHTGELERIDGRLGGITAHIGARVMAQAGAAEILATGTVRDLAVGSGATFEPFGEVELKGVPGSWALHRILAIDGSALPQPLEPDVASSRRHEAVESKVRAGWPVLVGAASLITALAVAIAAYGASRTGAPAGGLASPSPSPPVALMKLDPETLKFVATVRNPTLPPFGGFVQIEDGNLWYQAGDILQRRDLETAEDVAVSVQLPPEWWDWEPGLGAIWIGHGADEPPGPSPPLVDRLDPTNGRLIERIDPGRPLWDLAVGEDAVYLLAVGSEILEVDPASNEVVDRNPTRTETEPVYIAYEDGSLWLGEGRIHRTTEFDPVSDRVVGALEGPQVGFGSGGIDPLTGLFWIGDRQLLTITPFDVDTGEAGRPIGLRGVPRGLAFGFDALWLTAEEFVYRIDSYTRRASEIPMPDGVIATSVAIDEQTQTIWIGTCAVDCEDPI